MKKNFLNNKRGQEALEYLLTYGWAFLVILIILGALTYFGVFNPSRYAPDRCSFGLQIKCKDYYVNGSVGELSLKLRNTLGDNITITKVKEEDHNDAWEAGKTVGQSENVEIRGVPLNETRLIKDEKISLLVNLTFHRGNTEDVDNPTHSVLGEVYTTVQ